MTLDLYPETVTQQTSHKSSSVINLVYSYMANQTRFECSQLFKWSYQRGLCFVFSLPPSADSAYSVYQHLSQRTVHKTSWSNPRQTRICYIFRLRELVIKALVKQISLHLLLHFRIRIIVLTCPDNKSARNHQPKSCVPTKSPNHTNHNDARSILFQLNLRSLSVCSCSCEGSRVPPLNLY